MRTCPRCQTALESADYEGVQIDACGGCGGRWLDAGELKQIIDTREKEWEPRDLEAMKRTAVKRVRLDRVREDLPCPVCRESMEAFNYGGDTGIILDKCRHCGGVWLDAGELDKVQMVVEAWDRSLDRDVAQYGPALRMLELREEVRARRDADATRTPTLLYRILEI